MLLPQPRWTGSDVRSEGCVLCAGSDVRGRVLCVGSDIRELWSLWVVGPSHRRAGTGLGHGLERPQLWAWVSERRRPPLWVCPGTAAQGAAGRCVGPATCHWDHSVSPSPGKVASLVLRCSLQPPALCSLTG